MAHFTDPDAISGEERQVNSDRLVAGFRQQVWEHWQHGTGNCEGCPIRCENQRFDPVFGLFNYDADLMIVAQEPGTYDEFADEDDGRGRIYKTMPDEEANGRFNHPHLVEERGYDHKGIHEWDNLMEAARRLFDQDSYSNSQTGRPTVGYSLDAIYYTNSLKCSRLADSVRDVSNPSERNKTAREQCRTYLEDEIKYVNPQAIITFGKDAWKHTVHALGIEDEVPKSKQIKANLNASDDFDFGAFGDDPAVIPAYHWSNLGQQKRNLDFINDGGDWMYDKYFAALAQRVNHELGRETSR